MVCTEFHAEVNRISKEAHTKHPPKALPSEGVALQGGTDMRIGIRGHDLAAHTPQKLCAALQSLQVQEIQLVVHKSFPDFTYSEENIRSIADIFRQYGIQIAVYGCYIDPLSDEGQARFHEHIRYAQLLNAGCIATETALGVTAAQNDEARYQALVPVFRRFADDAAAHGVRCAVETVWVHPICSPEKTARLFADVGSDNLYAILDPVNLLENEADPHRAEKTQRAIELYGDRILAVHWKDAQADAADPAIQFACKNPAVTVITEGLTGERLSTVLSQLRRI